MSTEETFRIALQELEAEPVLAEERIGPYLLLGILGHGGMGTVYRAVHEITNRTIALKVVDFSLAGLGTSLEQMTQEAMAMASLRHPHVVTCYSLGEDRQRLYLALELMSGGDTAGLVRRSGGRLDEAVIRSLATACVRGLAAIHRAGLVHRDIKPSNILLDETGVPKLADFGLAGFTAPSPGNPALLPGGTPSFMPPECIDGEALADIRGDIYSLGVTMRFWATGTSPFLDKSPYLTLQRVLEGAAPDLHHARPDLSPELCAMIARAMHRDRAQRYQDPEALLAALEGRGPAVGETVPASPAGVPPQPIPAAAAPASPLRQRGWLIALGLVMVVIVGAAISSGRGHQSVTVEGADAFTGPAAAIRGAGYRLPWVGDELLRFTDHGEVSYSQSGQRLHLHEESWLESGSAAPLNDALVSAGALTIEMVLRPSNLTQEGPAQMFGIGVTALSANVSIGQSGSRVEVRLRTSATNPDGTRPHLVSGDGVLTGRWQHLVFVRRGSHHQLFVDGVRCAQAEVSGDLSAWNASYPMCVGNVHRGGFPWSGTMGRIVLAAHAWSDEAIQEAYRTWQQGEVAEVRPAETSHGEALSALHPESH